uniref:Myxovirus (influenza virus) resistance G n=1 Tax=Cyprinus carpio TaxID=7962 RepID=A0A8C1N5F2_CYPCA
MLNKMNGEVHSHLEESIRPYIDLIDTLRSVGIHKDLALPTIAVIGDQSSGKSSVLEALSGIALPRGTGIVTRCPLELKLKKVTSGVNWKAVLSYREKKTEFVNSSLVESYIEQAQNELAGKGVGICDELITLEVMSPDVCDLTLIDLPGIARVPVNGQPEDIEKQIKRLITRYIEKQETINMVVVPCNTDIATTEALKMAQQVDPEGKRTVGILTKPDLIDRGTETKILDIVQNKTFPLRKGYIMVKCRGQHQINEKISLEEAAETERDFFQKHSFFRCLLNEDKATIKSLATKLTQNLVDHIKKSLPQLNEQIKKQLWDLRDDLKECEAGPPQDPKGAKLFLTETIMKFIDQIKSISTGELIIGENLYGQLRMEFKKWNDLLNNRKPSFNNSTEEEITFNQDFRGRELLGFSNYKMFEVVLQKLPKRRFQKSRYLSLTKNASTVKCCRRILRYYEVFLVFSNKYETEWTAVLSSSLIFFQIVVQRMADQLPMMITLFMLKQTAQLLSFDMLSLLDGANVSELLFEDSDVGKKRRDLHVRLERMRIGQEKISNFI